MRRAAFAALGLVFVLLTAALPVSGAQEAAHGVTTAAYHVGDRWQLELRATLPSGERDNGTVVGLIEGPTRAVDAYGVERDALGVRVDWYDGDALWSQQRCHVLAGGTQAVREDFLYILRPHQRTLPVVDLPILNIDWTWETFFPETCDLPLRLAGRTFHVGERIAADEVDEFWRLHDWPAWKRVAGLSTPAEPTQFHGRPALRFSYALDDGRDAQSALYEGRLELTVAHGLPGIVASRFVGTNGEGERLVVEDELVAYAPGTGGALGDEGARLPSSDPHGTFLPYDPLAFDDAAWPLAYRYADALRALREDPRGDLAAFLASHPNAVLLWADHLETRTSDADAGVTWLLSLAAPEEGLTLTSRRLALQPVALNQAQAASGASFLHASEPPARVASSQTLASAGARGGLPPEAVRNVGTWLDTTLDGRLRSYVYLSDFVDDPTRVAPHDARIVFLDRETGGSWQVVSVRLSSEVARIAMPGAAALDQPVAQLAVPDRALGTAVVAAGLAALTLLGCLRWLMPLYARLRRERILHDPVRARILERIRAEPGTHEAALATDSSRGRVRHHLAVLRSHGLVFALDDGRLTRYYAAGHVPRHEARQIAALRSGSLRAVYDLYLEEPRLSLREAARRLGLSAPSVHRARRRLQREGLLPPAGGGLR